MPYKLAFYKYQNRHIIYPADVVDYSIDRLLPVQYQNQGYDQPYQVLTISDDLPKRNPNGKLTFIRGHIETDLLSPIFGSIADSRRWCKNDQNCKLGKTHFISHAKFNTDPFW